MPISYREKQRRRRQKRWQYVLVITALLLAVTALSVWLLMRYYLGQAPSSSEPGTPSQPVPEETLADTASTLVILRDKTGQRFVLLQAAPARKEILAVPIPAMLQVGEQTPLSDLFRQKGPSQAAAAIAEAIQLPISHYISLSISELTDYMTYLEGTLTFDLSQEVSYKDENGLPAKLKAGTRELNSNQIAGLLQFQDWTAPVNGDRIFAQLLCAVLNQNLLPGHRFGGDFAALCNTAQTDLRIDHYNAYAYTLRYLADSNTGSLCREQPLLGSVDARGLFIPAIDDMRHQTALYTNTPQ